MDTPSNLKPFPFYLPTSGLLSHPSIRSYLRKCILSIRLHYKRTYYKCTIISSDAFQSWHAVYSLVERSGITLKLFTVLSLIFCCTDNGKIAMPLKKLFTSFKGIFSKWYINQCRIKLEKAGFIQVYAYNPRNPSGPEKHIVLTGKAVQFYKSFTMELRNYVLDAVEDSNYPDVHRSPVPGGNILRF